MNNLTNYFKSKDIAPIYFIGFKSPLHLCKNTFNSYETIEKAEKDKKQFRFALNEMARRNTKNKLKEQLTAIENIKNLYSSREKVFKLYNDYPKLCLILDTNPNIEQDVKY